MLRKVGLFVMLVALPACESCEPKPKVIYVEDDGGHRRRSRDHLIDREGGVPRFYPRPMNHPDASAPSPANDQ